MITPEHSREYSESSSLNTSFSEGLRLIWEELSRKPYIKHKKTFFASAALGLVGLVTTIHEGIYFLDYPEASRVIERLGGQWYDNLSADKRTQYLESSYGNGLIYQQLIRERISYINEHGDNAYNRNSRTWSTVFSLPLTSTAALFGATFAFFWGLMDEKRTRNENIYRTPKGKLTYKA